MMENQLNASESLFGFAGWLTTRDEPITFSASHDCATIADLIKAFCEKNNLEPPRDRWIDNLVHPEESDITK